jgi:hypothetical protein
MRQLMLIAKTTMLGQVTYKPEKGACKMTRD